MGILHQSYFIIGVQKLSNTWVHKYISRFKYDISKSMVAHHPRNRKTSIIASIIFISAYLISGVTHAGLISMLKHSIYEQKL